ncbi:YXWGXW repeat-containing protein [Cupriavidus gilardii]|uniref:YXWGXW repeat-containing protein n=1 Tax=Cupriavidus gilardii TaxID=82541 RepID=UPI001571E1C5|nr:YXWGXW repeat-containing protein [Cupriavidus gilardii]NSX04064.1 YXWGXW repeat-containing protein [Cupriavidus gilardii]
MNRPLILALATLAAGSVFGFVSPAQAHDGPRYDRDHGYRHVAPPPPRYEAPRAARRGQVWVPGYWRAAGPRYVWQPGHWERARPGYRYVPERWVQGPRGWVMRPGHWVRFR